MHKERLKPDNWQRHPTGWIIRTLWSIKTWQYTFVNNFGKS